LRIQVYLSTFLVEKSIKNPYFAKNLFVMANTPSTYRILGVDPGTNILGYAILEVNGQELKPVDLGVVYLQQFEEHPERLKRIFERITAIISQYGPRYLAIEAPFYGKNPQSMLKLGRAQGVAMAAAITKGLEVVEYSPKKIKQSVTGNGNASKEQVAAMLQTTLKADLEGQYLDATDALAAAVCHHYQSRSIFGGSGKAVKGWEGFMKNNPDRVRK
jgi:crossover junction endodeoxyribonuclease RuvC